MTPQALPADVVIDCILFRLPVKSLLRFKTVCRSWRDAIEEPRFISKHAEWSASKGGFSYSHLVTYYSLSENRDIMSLFSFDTLAPPRYLEIPCPIDNSEYVQIIGSGNGVVCLYSGDRVFLWNPATRRSRLLPKSAIHSGCPGSEDKSCYGFGHSPKVDDCKLVRMFAHRPEGTEPTYRAEVFAIKDGSWREVPGIITNCSSMHKARGICVNGVVHWIAHGSGRMSGVLVSFDLGTDKFEQACLPDFGKEQACAIKELVVFKESLGLIISYLLKQDMWLEMWVRRSPGGTTRHRDGWAMIARVKRDITDGYRTLVGWGKRGEIFLQNHSGTLDICEATTLNVPYMHFDVHKLPFHYQLDLYSESLVPVW